MKYVLSCGIAMGMGLQAVAAPAAPAAPAPARAAPRTPAAPAALDKPAFTATAAELRAAAATIPIGEAAVTVLRDDEFVTYDDQGRAAQRYRILARIDRPAGVDDWGTMEMDWQPFYQDKPVLRARVIAPDGTTAAIDPSLFHDAPATTEGPSVFSDRRDLDAPLPRLVVGAIIEEEFAVADRAPLLAAGATLHLRPTRGVTMVRARVTIDAPTARGVRVVARGFTHTPTPVITRQAGRTTWAYDLGTAAGGRVEGNVPGDVINAPYVGVSTGATWAAVAADYARVVEGQLQHVVALPADLQAATPRLTVDRALAWVHAHVRYTGIELGESAIVPATPADTVQRGFGDCKDQAALLVGLLRAAGVRADLALLSTGPGRDVDRDLPGLGDFDHAIVRAVVDGHDLWIDATEADLPAGQLPPRDQGRRALIVAAPTHDLELIPAAAPGDNLIREVRTLHVAELDTGSATEVTEEHGVFRDNIRAWLRDTPRADATKSLARYVATSYHGELVRFTDSVPTDVGSPFQLTLELRAAGRIYTGRDQVEVDLFPAHALARLPDALTSTNRDVADEVAGRTLDYQFWTPHVYEVENRIELPPGYAAPTLVAREVQPLGTMSLTTTRRVDGATLVITYRLDTGKPRLTAAELVADRAAVLKLQAADGEKVIIPSEVTLLIRQAKYPEAIAAAQRLIAGHPKEAVHYAQLAIAYRLGGAMTAAKRAARAGTRVAPGDARAWALLGFELRFDAAGRLFGFDSDRAGAIAAYRKALALNPTHVGALNDLGDLLAVDAAGIATGDRRDRAEAVTLRRRLHDVTGTDDDAALLAAALLQTGEFGEAEAVARALPASPANTALAVAAIAGNRGLADALDAARASGADLARVLVAARARLLQAGAYDLARALAAAPGNPTATPTEAGMLARLAPVDLDALDRADPRRPAVLSVLVANSLPVAHPPWSAQIATELDATAARTAAAMNRDNVRQIPVAVMRDLLVAVVDLQPDGTARDGWRVPITIGTMREMLYVALDRGVATLVGGSRARMRGALARYALALLDQHDTAGAARWLQRLAEDVPADQLDLAVDEGPALAALRDDLARTGSPGRARLEEIAALIAARDASRAALPGLRRCAAGHDDLTAVCQRDLREVLMALGQPHDAVAVAAQITAADPDGRDGVDRHALALANDGKLAEAAALLDAALAKFPDDHALVEIRAWVAVATGPWTAAAPWVDRLTARPDVTAIELNNAAWVRVASGVDLDAARALTARAEAMRKELSPELANTIATIEAEADRPGAAWPYAQRSFELRLRHDLDPADWYVLGRIAESYGLTDDARDAYRRVPRTTSHSLLPGAFPMAERGLQRLAAVKPAP
jgi:tetratricopeptide (TPR) repeat protein